MKKSLILGATAMAALAIAPQAEAAKVKIGGHYTMRVQDTDITLTDTQGVDEEQGWFHRMQLNLDATVSDKTHAHLQFRPVDGVMEGENTNVNGGWNIKRVWMETEMYGVGIKAGNMPMNMHDKILYKDVGGSMAAVVVSKSFGDMTLLGMNVRVEEGYTSGAKALKALEDKFGNNAENDGANADNDEINLYGISLLGKAAKANYQVTWFHKEIDEGVATNTAGAVLGTDVDNDWAAFTLGTNLSGVKLTGTVIWESGYNFDGDTFAPTGTTTLNQLNSSGVLAALRVAGKTGFGGWKGYGFYSSEDFTHPLNEDSNSNSKNSNATGMSLAWDQGNVNGRDLLKTWATNSNADQLENVWGVGVGLSVKAGSWTISPAIDYASIVEDDVSGGVQSISDSAWGGSIVASTKLDEGTTFSLIAIGVDPSDDSITENVENMHSVQAEFKVKF